MSDKPSLFAELKRRNVYKVAVAYSVVGWLVMRVASTVVLVLLGFPIALARQSQSAPQTCARSIVKSFRRGKRYYSDPRFVALCHKIGMPVPK